MPDDLAPAALAELIASLRANLDDEVAWSVLGDLLAARGDPRGELIALDQQRASLARDDRRRLERDVVEHRVTELFERHRDAWLGPLAHATNLELAWRRGFVTAATVHGRPAGAPKAPTRSGIAATLEKLLALTCAALLREVTIPQVASCTKPAKLLVDAASERRAIVDSLALPRARCDRFAPLAELVDLRALALTSTRVLDLAALADMPALARLDLSRTTIDLHAFVTGFAALRGLELRAYPSGDRHDDRGLDALRGLVGLHELDLGEAPWQDLEPLGDLRELERLHLRGTDVFDLRPLARLPKLALLDLRGCPVADLEPLAGLELTELRIGWTRVRDLAPLRSLRKLTVLELSGTAIDDLGPLLELPSLTKIDMQGSEVREIQPLLDRGIQVIGRPRVATPSWRDLAEQLLRR